MRRHERGLVVGVGMSGWMGGGKIKQEARAHQRYGSTEKQTNYYQGTCSFCPAVNHARVCTRVLYVPAVSCANTRQVTLIFSTVLPVATVLIVTSVAHGCIVALLALPRRLFAPLGGRLCCCSC